MSYSNLINDNIDLKHTKSYKSEVMARHVVSRLWAKLNYEPKAIIVVVDNRFVPVFLAGSLRAYDVSYLAHAGHMVIG